MTTLSQPHSTFLMVNGLRLHCFDWGNAGAPANQRELALGVLRQQADGRWSWKLDPAYIQQRVQHGPPRRPVLWPALERLPCPTLVVWDMESDVLSEAQARRMVEVLSQGELVAVPGM